MSSPTGSGKSQAMKTFVNDAPRKTILFVTTRVTMKDDIIRRIRDFVTESERNTPVFDYQDNY